jgi:hypothetical protein
MKCYKTLKLVNTLLKNHFICGEETNKDCARNKTIDMIILSIISFLFSEKNSFKKFKEI